TESARVEKVLEALAAGTREEDAAFVVVDIPSAKIERVVSQPSPRRAIAHTAWRDRLTDVESRSAASLAQELKKLKITPVDDPDAILELLPVRRENDAAWAARMALVEYQFRKPLDFQGTGGMVFRAGEKL